VGESIDDLAVVLGAVVVFAETGSEDAPVRIDGVVGDGVS
jgi:hypothetical protein